MRQDISIKKVRSVERAFKILNSFTIEEPNLKLKDIVRKTELNRTTVYRILYTLEQLKVINYDENTKDYSLGIKIFELGGVFSSNFQEKKVIGYYLDEIKSKVHHTILVGKLCNDKLMYIDKRESRKELRVTSNIGKKRAPNYGILGKILMAYQKEDEIKRLLKEYPLEKYASKSLTNKEKFIQRLNEVRKRGSIIAYSEAIDGVVGVGVPIFKGNEIYASLGVIAPESIMDKEEIQSINRILKNYSKIISRELV